MCEDDEVDYLPGHGEEDEIKMQVDGDSDLLIIESDSAARKKVLDREKKAKAAKDAQRKKNAGPLLPLVLGPTWETEIGETTKVFKSMRIQFLNGPSFLFSLTSPLTKPPPCRRSIRPRSSHLQVEGIPHPLRPQSQARPRRQRRRVDLGHSDRKSVV